MNKESDIIHFIEEWPSEEGFVSPFINTVKHNRFAVDNVNFILCNTDEERSFWVKNIDNYLHLYIYVLLAQWNNAFSSDIIGKRFNSYTAYFSNNIDSEMALLYTRKKEVPINILATIGYTIDEFSWGKDLGIPQLPSHLKELGFFSEKFYRNYYNLLASSLNSHDVQHVVSNIQAFIDYCNNTDIFITKPDCFKALIEKLLSSIIDNKNLFEEIYILIDEVSKGEQTTVEFSVLKVLLSYYFRNEGLYLPSACKKDIIQLQKALFKIRVTDYIFNHYMFVDKRLVFEKDYSYGEYNYLRENTLMFSIWQQYVRPWNYLQYFEDSKQLEDVGELFFGTFLNNIYEECNSIVENIIKTAKEDCQGESWARKNLKEKTKNMFWKRVQLMIEKMQPLLFSYIKNKIEDSVKNALEDSLSCFAGIQVDMPKIKVLLESSLKTETKIHVSATYSKDDVYSFELCYNCPNVKELNSHLNIIIPSDFINMITDTYYSHFFCSWSMSTSDYNKDKLTICFNEYLEKYKQLFIMAIIWYLDYDIMIHKAEAVVR